MYIHKKTLHVHVPVHMALVVSVWLPSGSHLPNPHRNLQQMINKISPTVHVHVHTIHLQYHH